MSAIRASCVQSWHWAIVCDVINLWHEHILDPREGHGVRYGDDGQVIGVTIINARRLLDRDGHLTITLPHEVRVDARDLAGALV